MRAEWTPKKIAFFWYFAPGRAKASPLPTDCRCNIRYIDFLCSYGPAGAGAGGYGPLRVLRS
jgi:hypothetical protein